ncbi:hypothetical protein BGZ46_002178 [Entomortierella lignicola]|nr:hypothetical protein BGZ46_002178 [Entomortierella lignicola]
MDAPRRGPGPSNLGPAGSEPLARPLARRNTEMQKPVPLNVDVRNINNRAGGPSSGQQGARSRFQDEFDEIEQHVNALSLESDRDFRGSPTLTRSSSRSSTRPNMNRAPSQASRKSPARSGPLPNMANYGTSPPSDLRRMASGGRGLSRGDSVRSTSSNGMFRSLPLQGVGSSPLGYNSSNPSSVSGRSDDGSYYDEPVYSGLRDKLRVKCHYIDTRAVLVRADTPIKELIQRVQEKFQSDRPLKLKYKDEDQHMLSMVDDEDWLMAQQVHRDTTGSLDRMELWCFDDD